MSPYARLEITLTLVIGAAVTAVVGFYAHWWALLPGILALALLSFYRDPPRKTPAGNGLLIAAADGRIMKVQRDFNAAGSNSRELRIVIFLSVLNAHINRSPCAGTVAEVQYRRGEFLNALRSAATDRNESNLVVIQPQPPLPGPVYVRQIAGVLESLSAAARIASSTCFLRPRWLVAGVIRDSDSTTTAEAISVRKSFSEILMPAISRRNAFTCVVLTARTMP